MELPNSGTAEAGVALGVLRRAVSGLRRENRYTSARYVESNLGRWASLLGDPVAGLLQGYDQRPLPERAEVLAALDTLLGSLGEPELPVLEPKVRLLPEGLSLPAPRPPQPPPGLAVEQPPLPEPELGEERSGRETEEPRPEREAKDGRESHEHREPRERRDAREPREGREARPPREPGEGREGRRRGRGDRGGRPVESATGTEGAEARTESPPAEAADGAQGREGTEGRRPRETREERRQRRENERRSRREERAARPEAPSAEPVKVEKAPEKPPEKVVEEVRMLPLAHPEGTGLPVASLGIATEAELAALAAVDIRTVAELLSHAPIGYDRAGERWNPAGAGSRMVVRGTLRSRCWRFGPAGTRFELAVAQDRKLVHLRWIGRPEREVLQLKVGADVGMAGRLELIDDVPVLYEPEILGLDGRGGDWLPQYDLAGVSDQRMRSLQRAALVSYADSLADHLPPEVIERFKLLPLGPALRDAHFPANAGRKGRLRMAFDELLQVQLGIMLQQGRATGQRGTVHPAVHSLLARAVGTGGWSLPDAQEAAFDEIRRDLRRTQPMMRLLQGDVGSGKQVVIHAAMLSLAESQFQSLFLAPDTLTAEHRYLFAETFFRSVGLEPVLLSTPPTRAQLEGIRRGDGLIYYGTHAAISAAAEFKKLGLVVVEDPGPTGFFDTSALDALPHRPDLLVFTAMPVPTSVLLTVYGGLALTAMPAGTGRGAETVVVAEDQRETAYAAAREAIAAGQQVIIVLPLKKGQDLLPLSETRRLAQSLSKDFLGDARIHIFHGAMSREERFRAWDDFQHRRADVLLATTFIEHGPVVPNVSLLLVESADYFDGIRLHRLRGHVTHGWWRGRCLLISNPEAPPEQRAAVELVLKETDGHRIAAAELRRLGIEATLGERPEEFMDFGWGDPGGDRDLMLRTRQEAVRLLTLDPGMKRRTHRPLLYLIRARLGEEIGADAAPAGTPASGSGGGEGRRKRRRRR